VDFSLKEKRSSGRAAKSRTPVCFAENQHARHPNGRKTPESRKIAAAFWRCFSWTPLLFFQHALFLKRFLLSVNAA
jgi:hypothetical protein